MSTTKAHGSNPLHPSNSEVLPVPGLENWAWEPKSIHKQALDGIKTCYGSAPQGEQHRNHQHQGHQKIHLPVN
jgi:hypothetical protein